MSTELTTPATKASALALMANRFSVEPAKLLETLKGTVFKNATNEQLMALVVVANEYKLNPFCRQIYAFPDKAGGIVPVISVDGWLRMMQEHPQFDGIEFDEHHDKDGKLVWITATIHRKDRSVPTKVTEYLSECLRNTDPWKTSPHRMLRHRAAIQCIRVAFGLSGADPDEVERIKERETTGRVLGPSFNSQPVADGARGEPATGLGGVPHETPPVETPPPQAPPPNAAFALDGSPPSNLELLRDGMNEDNITLDDLKKFVLKHKLAKKADFGKLAEIPPDLMDTLVKSWGDVRAEIVQE